MRDFLQLPLNGRIDFGMIVAMQIGPNGGIGVQIFAPVTSRKHRAFAFDDDNRLALQPIAHLRKRMPDELVIKLGEFVHRVDGFKSKCPEILSAPINCRNVFSRMGGGQRDSQARLAAGDSGITNRRNKNTLLAQLAVAVSTALLSSPMINGIMALRQVKWEV